MQMVHMQVICTVAVCGFLFLPFIAPVLSVPDTCRHSYQQGQYAQRPRSGEHVHQRDAELVGAIRFFLVET
jgi:hypothetical protein